jgi:hypothetical protein
MAEKASRALGGYSPMLVEADLVYTRRMFWKCEGGDSFRHTAYQSESMSLKAWINELNVGLSTVAGMLSRNAFWEITDLLGATSHMPTRGNYPLTP